jgi:MlaD protein
MLFRRREDWAKVRVSTVAVAALSILFVLIYLLTGGTWLQPKMYVTTHVPDSTGLEVGADVLLNGVEVGKVESMRLTAEKDPNRVVGVTMKIEQRFLRHIPEDSVTDIDSENLLGDKYVDITMGRSTEALRPGGDLRYHAPSQFVTAIDLAQFEAQLRQIDQIIRDTQEGRGPLGEFITSDQLYRNTLDGVADIERKVRAASNTQTRLGQFLYSAEAVNNMRASLRRVDDRLAQYQAMPMLRDSAQYDQLRDQLSKLRHSLADFSSSAWLSSDAAWQAWNQRLAAWIEDVDALNASAGALGLANAQTYESLAGALRDLEKTVREFRLHPQKFLRVKF